MEGAPGRASWIGATGVVSRVGAFDSHATCGIFSHHVILSLSKHLRPFGYAQGEWMGQSKDPGARADGVDCSQLHVVLDPALVRP